MPGKPKLLVILLISILAAICLLTSRYAFTQWPPGGNKAAAADAAPAANATLASSAFKISWTDQNGGKGSGTFTFFANGIFQDSNNGTGTFSETVGPQNLTWSAQVGDQCYAGAVDLKLKGISGYYGPTSNPQFTSFTGKASGKVLQDGKVVTRTIGPKGGKIKTKEGAFLIVAGGFFAEDTTISIQYINAATTSLEQEPAGLSPATMVFGGLRVSFLTGGAKLQAEAPQPLAGASSPIQIGIPYAQPFPQN